MSSIECKDCKWWEKKGKVAGISYGECVMKDHPCRGQFTADEFSCKIGQMRIMTPELVEEEVERRR